ncbi:MAG: tripartite tricarboxylate transporter substrate binding protein [Acetobacteraceae bacterium]
MTWRLLASTLACVLTLTGTAAAQDKYPAKPIRVIVPFSVGGPTDILTRIVGAKMSEQLGQQLVIDNRAGAGGKVGMEMLAKAPPDGYTVGLATVSTHAINPTLYKTMPYDPVKDFAPVGKIGEFPLVLSVYSGIAATDVASLVALIRANPGTYSFGSPGMGSMGHLCGEALKTQSGGLDMEHVPYRGGGQMMNDIAAGQIPMAFEGTPTSLPQIQAGTIRPLASGSLHRARSLPEVKTMEEQGYKGFECAAWFALFAPAKTPQPIVARLSASLNAALADPGVAARLHELGVDSSPDTSPDKLAAFLQAQLAKWGPVVAAAGVQLD